MWTRASPCAVAGFTLVWDHEKCEALLALGEGNAVALAGTLTPKTWLDKNGTPQPAFDLVASQVLSAYHVTRKRKALERPSLDPSPSRQASPHGAALGF